jgi:hypothetical protein
MDWHFVSSFYPPYIRFGPVVTTHSSGREEFFQQKQCDGNKNRATVFYPRFERGKGGAGRLMTQAWCPVFIPLLSGSLLLKHQGSR